MCVDFLLILHHFLDCLLLHLLLLRETTKELDLLMKLLVYDPARPLLPFSLPQQKGRFQEEWFGSPPLSLFYSVSLHTGLILAPGAMGCNCRGGCQQMQHCAIRAQAP